MDPLEGDPDFALSGQDNSALPFENLEAVAMETDECSKISLGDAYISLSSSENNSNLKDKTGHVLENSSGSPRLDFSNLDFKGETNSQELRAIDMEGSHIDHTTSVSQGNEEGEEQEPHSRFHNLKISDIEIKTVPEDEDLFNMDNFPSTPAESYQGDTSVNPTPYDSGNNESSNSESEYSSSSGSGEYETDSSEEPVVNEDLASLARETYPVLMIKPLGSRQTKATAPSNKVKKVPSGKITALRLQERLEQSRRVTDRWLKDLEIPENLSFNVPVKIPIVELNQYLTCGLCFGYLYEASTITECMHTFCKNCIVRHCMEISLHCPTCSVLIHPTDPFVNIRLDRMIQDIVDKLLPQVPEEELRRIQEFYKAHPEVEPKEIKPYLLAKKPKVKTPPKRPNNEPKVPAPLVSVVIEQEGGEAEGSQLLEKKFLRVTGSATINHMSTYLKRQLRLDENAEIDIFCCGDTIEEETTTLLSIRERFFSEDECLMLLQYRVRES